MNANIRSPLSRRLVLYIVLCSSAITFLLTAVQLYRDYRVSVRAVDSNLEQVIKVYQKTIELIVWSTDREKLKILLEGISNLPNIVYVSVDDGETVTSIGHISGSNTVSVSSRLTYLYRGKILDIGVLKVVADLDLVYSWVIDQAVMILISNAINTILVAGFMLLIFHLIVTRHLISIADFISGFSLGGAFAPLKLDRGAGNKRGTDELDKIVESVNGTAKRVIRIFSRLQNAKEARRQSEARFRDFSESASDWFWETDENLRFNFFSDRFAGINGVAEGELIGKTVRESGLDLTDQQVRRNIEIMEAHRPFKNFEYRRVRTDGSIAYMSASGSPFLDENGKFKGYRGTGADITERMQAEEALRRTSEELEERVKDRTRELFESTMEAKVANRAKSDLIANMSHELRTPLNAIIGFSSMIKSETFGPLGKKYMEYANDIKNSGEHLLELINDILDVSAIEASKLKLQEEDLNVGKIIEATVHMVNGRANEGGVRLNRNIDDNLAMLHADKRRIMQILLNLLSNAVKFTPTGGEVTLTASLDSQNAHVLTVTDSGIGMDDNDLVKAMSEFGQVDSGLDRKQEGTGLGLPLTRGLIELHGGEIEISSRKGEGTTVRVRFPPWRTVRIKPKMLDT